MTFDHEEFLPPFVKLSTSPCCTYFSSQYDGTHYNDNAQHCTRYNSTKRTTPPLLGKSQRAHLSTVQVHNDGPIDSAHFAQPLSDNSTSTYRSSSLIHIRIIIVRLAVPVLISFHASVDRMLGLSQM
jgi:hypothetical protein